MAVKVFERVYDVIFHCQAALSRHFPRTHIHKRMHAYISIRLGGLSDKDIQHIKRRTFTDEKIIRRSELFWRARTNMCSEDH